MYNIVDRMKSSSVALWITTCIENYPSLPRVALPTCVYLDLFPSLSDFALTRQAPVNGISRVCARLLLPRGHARDDSQRIAHTHLDNTRPAIITSHGFFAGRPVVCTIYLCQPPHSEREGERQRKLSVKEGEIS